MLEHAATERNPLHPDVPTLRGQGVEALTAHGTTVKYVNRRNYRDYLADTYSDWGDIAIGVGMYGP